MTSRRREPRKSPSRTRPTTSSPAPRTAFGRAYQRNATLLPERPSVKAFVAWMRDLGLGGEQLVTDLHVEFCETMDLMGGTSIPLKRFGRALRNAGYPPFQADKEKDGKRWRPMAVNLSEVKPELAAIASNVSRVLMSATSDTRLPMAAKRLPPTTIQTQIAA